MNKDQLLSALLTGDDQQLERIKDDPYGVTSELTTEEEKEVLLELLEKFNQAQELKHKRTILTFLTRHFSYREDVIEQEKQFLYDIFPARRW